VGVVAGVDRTAAVLESERTMSIDELVAKLEQMVTEGAELDTVLQTAIQQLHELDDRFDWTGIYELFPDGVLRLGPFVGAPTEHVFIGVGNGVCGTAVAEKRNINVPDVRAVENYLACSTETRSELVVLIRDEETIYGQIDIDSHQVAAFDETLVAAVERVAETLAKAYADRGPSTS
jgi:GAF domain-containing protein